MLKEKISSKISDLRTYWNIPMPGRYMTFKEIGAYAGGGIGAYFLITMGSQLLVNTNNMIVGAAIGISPTHMYILYIIATLANIPLTAVRANMIDNSRNKAGKYRPYLLSMGIPTVIVCLAYVWFPYSSLYDLFPGMLWGYDKGYVAKLALVLVFNLLLQFYFNFFNDAYTNLIHVLSPNTQERTDVLAIKSVVYSLAPSIMNFVQPLIAGKFANDNLYDIIVYRISYPIFAVIAVALTAVVYGFTKEKIIQAKTHTINVPFMQSFKAVAKNKYFWIIALAGWLGFLETAYGNVLQWSYNYGHTCSSAAYGTITLLVGNASLWGMLIAPFCIRRFGKKKVLLGINFMNVVCILSMGLRKESIIWLTLCVYLNYLFGAFEQITTPAIQADIRDYHQYTSGERIDGMFGTVQTIGNIVTLLTSAVLPFVYESYGIFEGNGFESPYDILDINNGNGLLYRVMGALILMAGAGAFLNMVPYFFYDLSEVKQKGVVRVLKIRAMFEDYGNGIVNHEGLVEAIDVVRNAKLLEGAEVKELDKSLKKTDKAAYRQAKEYNEEVAVSKIVLGELDKFNSTVYKAKVEAYADVLKKGLSGLYEADLADIKRELAEAKNMPTSTQEEKELRKFAIEIASNKKSSKKAILKNYKSFEDFVKPDYADLDSLFQREDEIDVELKNLYLKQADAKKEKNASLAGEIKIEIKKLQQEKKKVQSDAKIEMDKHTQFAIAAKPFLDAEKLMNEKENYKHFDELAEKYEASKLAAEKARQEMIDEQKRLDEEKARIKAEKAASGKNKK